MKSGSIEQRINFEAPNTIGLESELWDDKPVRFLVQEIPIYAAVLSILPLLAFFVTKPLSISGGMVALGVSIGMNIGAHYIKKSLIRQHRGNQLSYRKRFVPLLVELLQEHGLTLNEDDQRGMTLLLKSEFKVTNDEGIQYRTSGITTHEGKISAMFFLSDVVAERALIEYATKSRIKKIIRSYEAKNGEFATPELREAFLAGVKHTLR